MDDTLNKMDRQTKLDKLAATIFKKYVNEVANMSEFYYVARKVLNMVKDYAVIRKG